MARSGFARAGLLATVAAVGVLFLLLLGGTQAADDAALKERLSKSAEAIKATLKRLRERWDVDNYPNFLASAAMTLSAWELMKVKFQRKILQAHLDGKKTSFVISFMGSSVTAGHGEPSNLRTIPQLAPHPYPLSPHPHPSNLGQTRHRTAHFPT